MYVQLTLDSALDAAYDALAARLVELNAIAAQQFIETDDPRALDLIDAWRLS